MSTIYYLTPYLLVYLGRTGNYNLGIRWCNYIFLASVFFTSLNLYKIWNWSNSNITSIYYFNFNKYFNVLCLIIFLINKYEITDLTHRGRKLWTQKFTITVRWPSRSWPDIKCPISIIVFNTNIYFDRALSLRNHLIFVLTSKNQIVPTYSFYRC